MQYEETDDRVKLAFQFRGKIDNITAMDRNVEAATSVLVQEIDQNRRQFQSLDPDPLIRKTEDMATHPATHLQNTLSRSYLCDAYHFFDLSPDIGSVTGD